MNIRILDNISAHYAGMNIAKQYRVRWTALDGSNHEWEFRALTNIGAIDRISAFRERGDKNVTVLTSSGETLFMFQDLE